MSMTRIELSGTVRLVSTAYFSTALMSSLVITTASFGAWANPAMARAVNTNDSICRTCFRMKPPLFHFDKLDGHPIGSLNHGRSHAAPRVNLFEKLNTLTFQASHRCSQIGHAKRPVIDQVAPRGDE